MQLRRILALILRTVIATIICTVLWFVSGKVFNFLPGILFTIAVILYYAAALLIYFILASDDIISTILGVLLSIAYLVLYIINIFGPVNLFVKGIFIFGILVGISQTLKSVSVRYNNGFTNA